jgi:ribosomal protein S18 acetylase RimI-like enzyme
VRRVGADDLNALTVSFTSELGRTQESDHADQAAGQLSFHVAWAGELPLGHVLIRWRGPRSPEVTRHYPGCAEVYRLSVLEPYRRRGIGSQLMAACEREARAERRAMIGLGVEHANLPARRLYEKLGYAPSSIPSYEDAYRARDAAGEVVWVRSPCAWLIRALGDDRS